MTEDGQAAMAELTARELEILQLLCEGRCSKAIGEIACISSNTVKWYIRTLTTKLGVRNRCQLVALAVYFGLAHPGFSVLR